jgi:predicted Fe-Mo cluster-binding NifX family protein
MKLCIPSMGKNGLNETVGEHFGRVPAYTVFDTETEEVKILDNTSEHMGGSGYPAEILAKAGINTMLCGGLGRRAISMFEEAGVMVFVGANGTVKEAIEMWKAGKLQAATDENACAQHAYRGDGIGEGHGDGHGHHHHH